MAEIIHLQGDRCPDCKGQKKIIVNIKTSSGKFIDFESDCSNCKGMGRINVPGVCKKCNGSKKMIVTMGELNFETTCDQCSGIS